MVQWKEKSPKQRSCDGGGGGAQRPVWRGNDPKKTGARSARARTQGQNPLVYIIKRYFLIMIANIYNLTLPKMKEFGEKVPDVHVSTVDSCTKAILFLSAHNFRANFLSSSFS